VHLNRLDDPSGGELLPILIITGIIVSLLVAPSVSSFVSSELIGYRVNVYGDEASAWIGDILEYKIHVSVEDEGGWDYLRVIFTIENHGRDTYGKPMGWGPFYLKVYTLGGTEIQRLEPRTRLLTTIDLRLGPGEEYVFEYHFDRYRVLIPGEFYISGIWQTLDRQEIETSRIKIATSYYLKK